MNLKCIFGFHWIHPFGIVDNDRRTEEDLNTLKTKGVYALSVYAVESIYYHPEIQRRVAERQASVTGENVSVLLSNAKTLALKCIADHSKRLSERTAEKVIRMQFAQQLPTRNTVTEGRDIIVNVPISTIVREEHERLKTALDGGDLATLIARYPVRETSALVGIAKKLGFQGREQYEGAVRKLLMDDIDALNFVKSLFGTLEVDIRKN